MTNWNIETPDDFRTAYAMIRDELTRRIHGHEDSVRHLSLLGARHVAGVAGQRALLVGPSGCGKSSLTRALAEALDVPWLLIDVTMMSEQNWQGEDLSDFLDSLYRKPNAGDHAVVVLDELDKVCLGAMSRDSVAGNYRRGKQESLLPLFGTGSEIPLPGGRTCRPDGMLVIGAGVFHGLPPGPVAPGGLLRLGLMHEIVERLGTIIHLEPLGIPALVRVLREGMAPSIQSYRLSGFTLEVPAETLAYVGSFVLRGDEAGPRSGVSWLRAAADRLLVRLIEQDAPYGSIVALRPDDLVIPTLSRRDGKDGPDGADPSTSLV